QFWSSFCFRYSCQGNRIFEPRERTRIGRRKEPEAGGPCPSRLVSACWPHRLSPWTRSSAAKSPNGGSRPSSRDRVLGAASWRPPGTQVQDPLQPVLNPQCPPTPRANVLTFTGKLHRSECVPPGARRHPPTCRSRNTIPALQSFPLGAPCRQGPQ